MSKKQVYQLGMERQYAAHVLLLWNKGRYPCDIRVRRAKTDNMVVIEVDDLDLANEVANAIRCKVAIKEAGQHKS